jgi:hypothetical protein
MMDELIGRVEAYLDGASSLDDFEIWFYDLAFDVEARFNTRVVDLVHQIEGVLAESSSAHWPNPVLRKELEESISTYRLHPRVIRFNNNKQLIQSSSAPAMVLRDCVRL